MTSWDSSHDPWAPEGSRNPSPMVFAHHGDDSDGDYDSDEDKPSPLDENRVLRLVK